MKKVPGTVQLAVALMIAYLVRKKDKEEAVRQAEEILKGEKS